ncbi:hypothetical protein [Streptomyces sp. URMC 123]|uniref:hypothetical protein n=1 Tax=Streptomyces sp. URMC 123 TaxID=3423403 RepID=UPI003F1D27BC
MGSFTYTDLITLDLGKLNTAVGHWKAMVDKLAQLKTEVKDGLVKKSEAARWQGANATVTKEFVRSTAKEFGDLHAEAQSIHNVLKDAHAELLEIQKRAKALTEEAANGDPSHTPEPDPSLLVLDGGNGTVKVIEAMCTAEGTSQRTKDLMRWYADTIAGLVSHAAEVDAAVTRALKSSHGGDPHNAGHASYTSLDEDQLPRAMKLASLGDDANAKQRAELRRLWESLSPEARAELWKAHRNDLLDAGLLKPTVKKAAPDRGSGPYRSEDYTWGDIVTNRKMRILVEGADWTGSTDAARHMAHYMESSGKPMELPVDKMMKDDEDFKAHIDSQIDSERKKWHKQALEEFKKSGGRPVAIPVETENEDYSFNQDTHPNWFYAVGSTRSNVTGVVTVVPDAQGNPKVSLDYQANAWDRYNWDIGKGVDIYGVEIPDGDMARQHRVGFAREFDVAGSSSVKHYELGGTSPNMEPLPGPGRTSPAGGTLDPTRDAQQDRDNPAR